ncbi:interferon-induced GTP-binding protein Mx2, partial [Pyrenophora tritici-repentis]
MYFYAQRTSKGQRVQSDTAPGAPQREHSHADVNSSGNKNDDDSENVVEDEKAADEDDPDGSHEIDVLDKEPEDGVDGSNFDGPISISSFSSDADGTDSVQATGSPKESNVDGELLNTGAASASARVGDDQGISREEVNRRVMSIGASNAAVARADNAAEVKKGARVEDIYEVQEVNVKDASEEEVDALMSIKTIANTAGENTFSEDVLKIEKCGPNEDYLTIIDVPGIFHNIDEGVTTKKDKKLVEDMVKRYIKDSRTIILAVLPSNVDVATQEILTLAEEADPAGDRTLGILTKADLLTERTARLAVVNLVEGNRKPLKLGYHVVANRGGDDHGEEVEALAALRERETVFLEHPWDNLPEDRLGISSLRERLEDLLGEITDRAFPELRGETRKKLETAEKKLKDLGAPRKTEREQQQYL